MHYYFIVASGWLLVVGGWGLGIGGLRSVKPGLLAVAQNKRHKLYVWRQSVLDESLGFTENSLDWPLRPDGPAEVETTWIFGNSALYVIPNVNAPNRHTDGQQIIG
jgi:hypothetical protein